MAGKSALPLLALAGVGAVLLTRKKKKKKTDNGYEPIPDIDPLIIPDSPDPPPKKTSKRPSGNPPRGNTYDPDYWGSSTIERMTSIRQHIADLGYDVKVGPWPVNIIGPKGELEVENEDGTTGRLGGNDDKSNRTFMQFQNDYNAVSRCGELGSGMGGLAPDGLVGYFSINGLRAAKEKLGAKNWQDVLRTCGTKGFNP